MQAAIQKSELLSALRWTSPVKPDVPPPISGAYTEGWTYNAHSMRVEIAWSSVSRHGIGYAPSASEKYRTASQRPKWLFSSRDKAIAALRHDIENASAELLLRCDKMMDNESDRKS
jgi:hypothetical protein